MRSIAAGLAAITVICAVHATAADTYVPGPGPDWQHLAPEAAGMDATRLAAAIAFANTMETDFPRDFSAQRRIFGRPLGPVPTSRAGTNGVVLRHGYIVAEWGNTQAADPTYSVAKSFLSTLAGIAADSGLIDVHDPVSKTALDGYDSEHNAKVTWQMHLQQTSEWEGAMWGKSHDFIGEEEFGEGQRKPREFREPGTCWEYNDVRINRLALSLAQVYQRPLPEVLAEKIMQPIGASSAWRYYGYFNSQTTIAGRTFDSVSGGSRWGGGLWISTRDMARFGLLMLRDGRWGERQVVPAKWVREATSPATLGPDYGYLWWLNTKGGQFPSAPGTAYAARGFGSNTIVVDPEHDLVVVWRWHRNAAMDEFLKRAISAIN